MVDDIDIKAVIGYDLVKIIRKDIFDVNKTWRMRSSKLVKNGRELHVQVQSPMTEKLARVKYRFYRAREAEATGKDYWEQLCSSIPW